MHQNIDDKPCESAGPVGPVSITVIDNSTPIPVRHSATLTISFPLDSYEGPIDPAIAENLEYLMHCWDEGRYPFCVEMVKNGLHDCLKVAARDVVEKAMQRKHGREMVVSPDGRSQTARWLIETEKVKPVVPYINESIKVKINNVRSS